MGKHINSPILFIGFNRPDTTEIVFKSIRKIKPEKLYVAIDGPRKNKPEEQDLCRQVLEITKKVDWLCNVKYLIRDKNLGCKLGVSQAISWALENEDRVIIIEDDIVASPSFFYFADEMLERYKNEKKIVMVSANNYTPIKGSQSDYLFSKYGHIWGWGTWKRAWDTFDVEVPYIDSDIKSRYLKQVGLQPYELKYFRRLANRIKKLMSNGKINAWGYQFAYFRIRNKLISIVPKVNLASNIGIKSSRIKEVSEINTNYYAASNDFTVINHPEKVECNIIYDNYHFKYHLNKKPSFAKRVLSKIRKKIKLK